jgi:hypothetical protein
MVKDMKSLRDKVTKVDDAWTQGDQQLLDSFQSG